MLSLKKIIYPHVIEKHPSSLKDGIHFSKRWERNSKELNLHPLQKVDLKQGCGSRKTFFASAFSSV